MADNVWDLHKAIRGPQESGRPRSDSDTIAVLHSSTAAQKASDIAHPGGFRRQFVQQKSPSCSPMVEIPPFKSSLSTLPSKSVREGIISAIRDIYDPFITGMLAQDEMAAEDFSLQERINYLLETPGFNRSSLLTPKPHLITPHNKTATEYSSLLEKSELFAKSTDQRKTTTLAHALLALLKAFVGTGILFLPQGFKNGGMLFSIVTLSIVAYFTCYAMLRLLDCKNVHGGTYGHIGYLAYGVWGHRMVQVSIVLMQMGFCCTYIIFVAKNVQEVLVYFGYNQPLSMLILAQIAIYIPLSWIRYISYFTLSNLVADLFILYGLCYILFTNSISLESNGVADVVLFNQLDYSVFIGTAIFTFEGIGLVLPTQSSLNKERQAKFPRLLILTVIGLLIFYIGFAAMNYATYGSKMESIATMNLPTNNWSISVQLGYSIAQMLSYPLFLFPAVKIIESGLYPPRKSGYKWRKNMIRSFTVIFSVLVSYFGQSHLDLFVSIVGAFCCVPLSFVYPPLFYLKLFPNSPWYSKVQDYVIIFLGMGAFVFVTYSNLVKWMIDN